MLLNYEFLFLCRFFIIFHVLPHPHDRMAGELRGKREGAPHMAASEPVKKWEPFVNGAEGCVRETRKGVLHDDDPHFSELLEALKNASAWRKDFSPRKKGIPAAFATGIPFFDEIPVKYNSITVRLSRPYTAERRPPWPSSLGQASRCWRSPESRG